MTEKRKYLNVAQNNNAARTIAWCLSDNVKFKSEGLSEREIYEFEAPVMGQVCQMVMTSVSGHLMDFFFPVQCKKWNEYNPIDLFEEDIFKDFIQDRGTDRPIKQEIKKILEREILDCQGLIIWTNCNKDGENIGFEIKEICEKVCVNRKLEIHRAQFSEITKNSVEKALEHLGELNRNLSLAVDVRMELDLRTGAAFTRFQTLLLERLQPLRDMYKFFCKNIIISYGSCQFPTLGFVVKKYRQVEEFVAQQLKSIKVKHTLNNLSVDFKWAGENKLSEKECQVVLNICTNNPRATITNVKTEPTSKLRPLPLNALELTKLAARVLKLKAATTMNLAMKLYDRGFISYPWTENTEYPEDTNLRQLVELQKESSIWGDFAQRILDVGIPTPRQGFKGDAHPPICPTRYTNDLSGNQEKLYNLIVRSFLASCSADAQGQETLVTAELAGEVFTASGLTITARNYLDVYPYDKWSSKEIHVYEIGQTFNPTSINLVKLTTLPPNLLTEVDLIELMTQHGIGTDETYLNHIAKITDRLYVTQTRDMRFVPIPLGNGLVEGYKAMGLECMFEPDLREELENDLRAICKGEKDPEEVLNEQISQYKKYFEIAEERATKLYEAVSKRFPKILVLPKNTLTKKTVPSTLSDSATNTVPNQLENSPSTSSQLRSEAPGGSSSNHGIIVSGGRPIKRSRNN